LGLANVFDAELMGIILAVECAVNRNWNFLWIETNSMLATMAIKSPHMVPWELKNRWLNCIHRMNNISCFVTHIFREGNHCADRLAALGLTLNEFTWWNNIPVSIREHLVKNRLGIPYYRFS